MTARALASALVACGARPVTPRPALQLESCHVPEVKEPSWLGHMPDGSTHLDCLDAIDYAFLRDPCAPLDTSCIATIEPPPFAR